MSTSLSALLGLAFPDRFGRPQETLADKRFASPGAILASFGVAKAEPVPGRSLKIMQMADANAYSAASALQPAARDDQFSIKISHGVYKLAPHITKRDGFNSMVLNFQKNEGDGRWRLLDMDYRKFEDQHPQTIGRGDVSARDFGRLSDAAQKLLETAVKAGPKGSPARLDRFGEIISDIAGRYADKIRRKPSDDKPGSAPGMRSAA